MVVQKKAHFYMVLLLLKLKIETQLPWQKALQYYFKIEKLK